MSTLKVNTIQNTSGGSSSTPEQIENGRAKAWVTFQAVSGVSVVSHFNVSSMTDHATGVFTVNFASALANANYMVTSTATSYDSDHTSVSLNVDARSSSGDTIQLKTTSACKFICNGGSTTEYDPAQGYCGFFST